MMPVKGYYTRAKVFMYLTIVVAIAAGAYYVLQPSF